MAKAIPHPQRARGPSAPTLALLVLACATLAGLVAHGWVRDDGSSSGPADEATTAQGEVVPVGPGDEATTAQGEVVPARPGYDAVIESADGVLPEGATPFDDSYPGVANLDPELLTALRAAAVDAMADGVTLQVNSGWRSAAYQDELLGEAVVEHGSVAAAERWVATADSSLHVLGEAVDVGPARGAAWLTAHGAAYGLCRVYRNKPWHFELRPDAGGRCPRLYADPSRDPRL